MWQHCGEDLHSRLPARADGALLPTVCRRRELGGQSDHLRGTQGAPSRGRGLHSTEIPRQQDRLLQGSLTFCSELLPEGGCSRDSTSEQHWCSRAVALGCHCSPSTHSAPDCCPRDSTPPGLSRCFAGPHPLHSSLVSPGRGSDLKCKA